ncbi:MAG: ROK family protein, partial [Chitinophagaceae bacterium]
MDLILGIDIGGTHLSGGLIEAETGKIIEDSFKEYEIHSGADASTILKEWKEGILDILRERIHDLAGIGVAMPGPFDYENGISYIKELGKYDALYGLNIKRILKEMLNLPSGFPVQFQNDAICFAAGEYEYGNSSGYHNILSLTLGTGLGTAFLKEGNPVQAGAGIPDGGTLYHIPYKNGIAEDYFSARGLTQEYERLSGKIVRNVKYIYDQAKIQDTIALKVFNYWGKNLASFLISWLHDFKADCLLLGGKISKASEFFMEDIKREFNKNNLPAKVITSKLEDKAAILGAASLLRANKDRIRTADKYRETGQFVLPLQKKAEDRNEYDIYPAFHLPGKKIYSGISALIPYILKQKTVLIDGYAGIFWKKLKEELQNLFPKDLKINIIETNNWLLSNEKIDSIVKPYLGDNDSVWGKKCDKELADFFDINKIRDCKIDQNADINIVIGVGAALCNWNAPVIYFELPKNELQYRMRGKCVTNLGCSEPEDAGQMYKRFYFVDWVLLNKHKKDILNRIDIIADCQRSDTITWMYFADTKEAMHIMSENVFRVRPWFEPGAWGGQWIK